MKKRALRKLVLITAAIAVAGLGIAAIIGLATTGFHPSQLGRAGGTTIDEKRSLASSGIELLTVSGVSEDVRITEASGGDIEAWFHGSVGASGSETIPHLVTERQGSTAQIRVDRKGTPQLGFLWSDLVLEVRVPVGYARKLTVQSVSGGIELAGHTYSSLSLASTSGDIKTGALTAVDAVIASTSGDVIAESVISRSAAVSTVSGLIQIRAVTGDSAVHTTSGDVKLTYAASPSHVDASSTSGSVTIVMPPDASFHLDARSTSGDVRCAFPITISGNSSGGGGHSLYGVVGAGTGSVSIRTVSGEIQVLK